MTLFSLLVLISLTSCHGKLVWQTLKDVMLTPNNTNEDGANISISHPNDVLMTSHNQWNIITTDQIGFHLHISLDKTWGFAINNHSTIGIQIFSDDNSKSFNGDILTSFSVNHTRFIIAILYMSNLQNNQIYPHPAQNAPRYNPKIAAYGDIQVLVNNAETNASRIQKATNISNMNDIPLMYPTNIYGYNATNNGTIYVGHNNSFPLWLRVRNYASDWDDMVLDVVNQEWDPFIQHNSFVEHLPTNLGLDMYVAVGNNGDALNITSIRVYNEYEVMSLAPTNKPTLNPTSNTNEPTSNTNEPTTNPSIGPTMYPSNDPTINPTEKAEYTISYGIGIIIVFEYEASDNNKPQMIDIDSIIPNILKNIIDKEEEVTNDCDIDDDNYDIDVIENTETIVVNATIFVCDESTQETLQAFLTNDNKLKSEFITSFNNETNLIAVPNDFKLTVEPIIIYPTTTTVQIIPSQQQLIDDLVFPIDININILFVILAIIICIAVIITIMDIIFIHKFDHYHIKSILYFVLTVCNLITDTIISYQLCMYYMRVNDDTLILMITIIANISVIIPYLYNKILGTFKVYVIPSHLCCLSSYLLVIISGDLYVTLKLLTSNIFNTNTINYTMNKWQMIQIKVITIITYNIPQIILQSIFMWLILQSIHLLLTISIILSFITIIPYLSLICVFIKCKQMIHTEYILNIKMAEIPQNKNNASNLYLLTKGLSDILEINQSEIQMVNLIDSKIHIIHQIEKKSAVNTDQYIIDLYKNKMDKINGCIENIYSLNSKIEIELNLNTNDDNNDNNKGLRAVPNLKLQVIPSNTNELKLNMNNYSHNLYDMNHNDRIDEDESNEEDEELYEQNGKMALHETASTPFTPITPGSINDNATNDNATNDNDDNDDMVLDKILYHVINEDEQIEDKQNNGEQHEEEETPYIGDV